MIFNQMMLPHPFLGSLVSSMLSLWKLFHFQYRWLEYACPMCTNVHCTTELVQNPANVKVKKWVSLVVVSLHYVCLAWNRWQAKVGVPWRTTVHFCTEERKYRSGNQFKIFVSTWSFQNAYLYAFCLVVILFLNSMRCQQHMLFCTFSITLTH